MIGGRSDQALSGLMALSVTRHGVNPKEVKVMKENSQEKKVFTEDELRAVFVGAFGLCEKRFRENLNSLLREYEKAQRELFTLRSHEGGG